MDDQISADLGDEVSISQTLLENLKGRRQEQLQE